MPENIFDNLSRWSSEDPDRLAFVFHDVRGDVAESFTYGELDRHTDELAYGLKHVHGIAYGDPVPLIFRPGLKFILTFLACAKIGALPIPLPPPGGGKSKAARDRFDLIAASSGAKKGLTEAALLDQLRSDPEAGLAERISWTAAEPGEGEGGRLSAKAVNPLLFLQYTSGSTHAPRGVMVSHTNVIENCRRLIRPREIGVSWLPHFHDMGLIGARLFLLIVGGTLHAFSPADFLRRPALWFELITRTRANVTAAPNFGLDYCLREDRISDASVGDFDLSSLRMMMNGSEPVRAATMDAFAAKFSRAGLASDALFAAYGLAEYTLCVSSGGRRRLDVSRNALQGERQIQPRPAASDDAVQISSCGAPIDGVDLRIVDPETGRSLPDGALGEIWIDGPFKAHGYWQDRKQTSARFEAQLASPSSPNGATYLRTGDIGAIFEGELYLSGRMTDMIVVSGANFFANDVETALEELLAAAGVRGAVSAAVTGRDAADHEAFVVLVEAGSDLRIPPLDRLHARLKAVNGAPVTTIAVVGRGSIERTSSGKIAHYRIAEAWRQGSLRVIDRFDVPAEEPSADPLTMIQELAERLSADAGDDTTLGDMGLDSIELVNLSLNLERLLKETRLASAMPIEGILDLRVLQTVSIGQLRQLFADAAKGGIGAVGSLITRLRNQIHSEELERMRRDAQLRDGIRPLYTLPLPPKGRRLLTGATGFLGSFLLEALLRLTRDEIVVIARSRGGMRARDRVHAALRDSSIVSPSHFEELARRITVIDGDLAEPRLGLSPETWCDLASSVTTIYHCGADVDYVKTYQALAPSNVEGTREMIALACEGAPKSMEYVSTTFIYGWAASGRLMETDSNAAMRRLDFGYTQTKWVAEQLVHTAIARGVNARIYRPAFVTASLSGRYARGDVMARVLGYVIRHAVTTTARSQISILPVDVCATNIIALSLTEKGSAVYNMTARQRTTLGEICAIATDRFGYVFDPLPYREAIDHVARFCTQEDDLFPLRAFIILHADEIESMVDKIYDHRTYIAACARNPLTVPEPHLEETACAIVAFLRAEKLVPQSPVGAKHSVEQRLALPLSI
jgi:thioester reductase-like protein